MLIKNNKQTSEDQRPNLSRFSMLGLLLLLEEKRASPPPAWPSWESWSQSKTQCCHTATMASESLDPEHSHMSLWTRSVKLQLLARLGLPSLSGSAVSASVSSVMTPRLVCWGFWKHFIMSLTPKCACWSPNPHVTVFVRWLFLKRRPLKG